MLSGYLQNPARLMFSDCAILPCGCECIMPPCYPICKLFVAVHENMEYNVMTYMLVTIYSTSNCTVLSCTQIYLQQIYCDTKWSNINWNSASYCTNSPCYSVSHLCIIFYCFMWETSIICVITINIFVKGHMSICTHKIATMWCKVIILSCMLL